MDVQFRQLRTLVALADAGTFTDAAAVLGVSQAAVSRSIAALESALGARLVQRTTRHVAFTVTGTRVLAHARRVLEDVAHLHRLVEDARGEVRIGFAWAALGRHTRELQRRWARVRPGLPLVFVQADSPTAGLAEGLADVAVIRRPIDDARFATAVIGEEARFAAVAGDNPLARKRSVRLADVARYTVAMDSRTGTTTTDLWPEPPAAIRATHGLDEWLTLIAAGQAVGITPEATAHQNPRPGVAYRVVRDAERVQVRLAWWRDDEPAYLPELLRLGRERYAS